MTGIDGETLRAWRRARGWDVPKMAQELRRAARETGQQIAAPSGLVRMIYAWERGDHRLTERYELLYRYLGLRSSGSGHVPALPVETETASSLSMQDFLMLAATSASLLDMLGTRPPSASAGRTHVDEEAADGLAQVLHGYRKVYRSAGAAALLGPVCGTLGLLDEMAPVAGPQSDVIVSLIGQAGSLAGVILMLDRGEFAPAARYLAVAARAAQQSGDDELLAITFACRAFHAAYSGDPRDGLAFASEALEIAGGAGIHPRTHGWVAAVASEMHATLGEHAACMHALDTAAGQLGKQMPAEPWKGIGAFSTAKLTAYRGGDLMRLGRYREARTHLQLALAQLDPALAKHRCTAHIDLAAAYSRDSEPAQAARHAIRALDIIEFTHHADSLRRVAGLYETIRPSGTEAVRELGSRLLAVRAAS
ncbi:MAG TPA: tetratricopeptide repeat protein [Streptosporangiaceae bacterium]